VANLASLIAAEYAFADLSARLGTRDAFLAHLADDSILFRPRPVPGKMWMVSQPARPGRLMWYPSFATIARAGDLGCTTGPWTFRPGGPDDDPIAHGYFVSLWRVQPVGQWKVELDCGVTCPPPPTPLEPLQPEAISEPRSAETAALDPDQVCLSLLVVERALANDLAHAAVAAVYDRYCADEAQIYRAAVWPYRGRAAIRDNFEALPCGYEWQPIDVRTSRSGDLGYVYGLVHFTPSGRTDPIESCYLRAWKQVAGRWQLLIDVDCPISEAL
jgi:ketosteroid isomerase-like protein